MKTRKRRLLSTRSRVQHSHQLGGHRLRQTNDHSTVKRIAVKSSDGLSRNRLLNLSRALRCCQEAQLDAGPVALQGRQDLTPDANPRVDRVGVGGILEGDDPATTREFEDVPP